MRNIFKIAPWAMLLAFLAMPVQAAVVVESTESDDVLDAVGEITSSVRVANRGDTVTVFLNGTYVATAWLQRERGSPGSGAWENVKRVTNGTDNATIQTSWVTRRDNTSWRVFMDAFTSGDIVAQVTNASKVPTEYAEGRTYQRYFDDFFTNTSAVNAEYWITAENDGSGTVCVVTVTIQEGAITCISGTGEDGLDVVALSFVDLTDDGALVSDGVMVSETRLQVTDFDGQVGFCLHDEEATASQLTPFDVDSNVVLFDTGNQADSVCLMNQDEATSGTTWQPVSANTDVEGNNSDEYETVTVVDATYVILRIELDSSGDAYFYIDGVLVYAENEVVATTARLIPFIWVNTTTDGSGGAVTVIIDYVDFIAARPSA